MERQIADEGTGVIYGSVFPHTHVPGSRITYADVREAVHEDELLDFPFQFITPLGSVVKGVQEHKGYVMDMKVTIRRIEGQDALRRYSPGDSWHRLRPSSQYEEGPDTVAQTFQGILQNLSQNTSSPARGRTPSSYNTPPPVPTTSSPRPMLEYVPLPDNAYNNNANTDDAAPAIVAPAVAHRLATPESRAAEGNASQQQQQQLQHKRVRKPSVKLQEIAAKTANDTQSRGITATPASQQQPQQPPHHRHQQQQQQVPRETPPPQPGSAQKKARRSGFMAWEEARAAVQSMQMKGYNDWVSWCKAGSRPPTLPASPHVVYKDHWISWPNFLGTNGRLRPAGAAVKSTPQLPAQPAAAAPVAERPAGAGAAEPVSTSTHQHMVTTTAPTSFGDPHSAPEIGQVLRHDGEAVTDPA